MVNPRTVNAGIIVPLTGADVDVWGEQDVNPNMVAIDGMFSGVQTIAVTNVPVTLSSPAGFVATPSPGPTQSQNRVLRFTGALSGQVIVTLPLPGVYVIDNLTTGNFTLVFRGLTLTEYVAVDQGARQTIYNDGANVRFVDMPRVATMEFWAGISVLPDWVNNCAVKPFLPCDGAIYSFSAFPYLANKMLGNFGGNGLTTFGVPDLRGRVPLSYDGTGARITAAGCGINGQLIGASQDKQTNTLLSTNLPPYTPAGAVSSPVSTNIHTTGINYSPGGTQAWMSVPDGFSFNLGSNPMSGITVTSTFTGTAAPGQNSTPVNNVQPSQVAGIWVIKT